MDNKILKKPYIEFVGGSATDVTGSAYLVRFLNYHILLEYGLVQTSDDNADYVTNNKRHKDIKPKKIDYIILSHCHIDHCGLIPKLYREGCNAPLFVPKGSKGLLTIQLQDSVKIFTQEYERSGRAPLYTQEDVDKALSHVVEVEFGNEYKINNHITFQYYYAQHIVKAAQILLTLDDGINKKRIGYTGDISDYRTKYFVSPLQPLPFCDILIGESTYGNRSRMNNKRDRANDINKLRHCISVAKEHKSHIVIPVFALDRLQGVMTLLHELNIEESIDIPIYIDTPLGISVCKEWKYLSSNDVELWSDVWNDEIFNVVRDFEETEKIVKSKKPTIVLAGGGMVTGGKSRFYLQKWLPNPYNQIIFSGFCHPNSTGGKLKSGELKKINIDGKTVKNNAYVTSLNSFSSHADTNHLLEYYTNTMYNKIVLVHGEEDAKLALAKELKEALSEKNKTSKVAVSVKDMRVYI